MNLIDVILELIKQFSLVPTDKQRQLRKDCEDWEETALIDSEDKVKSLYAKIHKGIWLRLLNPFLFFYLRKEFSAVVKTEDDELFT